ncbi:MAG: carboxypeptidase regulatory-like domain-containing protein [Gemmatimonadaceae bacterium]|nr:carboxypeptidase regulatory-like domain-containing protein [Gemmatimonadaceae bacterium]
MLVSKPWVRALVRLAVTAPAWSTGAQVTSDSGAVRPVDALVIRVVDVVGQPMPQVEVSIVGSNRSGRTDDRGIWRTVDPPPGPRVVMARSIGYVPYSRELLIGNGARDTITLLLRRFPRTLTTIEVQARTRVMTSRVNDVAERLLQMRVGSGRLFTREEILQMRPYSVAELVYGVPGVNIRRGQSEIVATSTRAGVGIMNVEGQACQLQFYLDSTPIDNEGVVVLDPTTFRSVEVYPQTVQLTGLAMRPDRCGAIVINSMRQR